MILDELTANIHTYLYKNKKEKELVKMSFFLESLFVNGRYIFPPSDTLNRTYRKVINIFVMRKICVLKRCGNRKLDTLEIDPMKIDQVKKIFHSLVFTKLCHDKTFYKEIKALMTQSGS